MNSTDAYLTAELLALVVTPVVFACLAFLVPRLSTTRRRVIAYLALPVLSVAAAVGVVCVIEGLLYLHQPGSDIFSGSNQAPGSKQGEEIIVRVLFWFFVGASAQLFFLIFTPVVLLIIAAIRKSRAVHG